MMKNTFNYFRHTAMQHVKNIIPVILLTATIPTALITPSYSQESKENMSQTIKELSKNPKIKITGTALKKLEEGNTKIRIIVNICDPKADLLPQLQAGHAKPRPNFRDMDARKQLQKDVAEIQDKIIKTLDANQVNITNKFTYIFGFSAETTLQGLHNLANNPHVLSIDEDKILHIHPNHATTTHGNVEVVEDIK